MNPLEAGSLLRVTLLRSLTLSLTCPLWQHQSKGEQPAEVAHPTVCEVWPPVLAHQSASQEKMKGKGK
eukprot:1141273-Pelagomonas_calceolata.AAC.9